MMAALFLRYLTMSHYRRLAAILLICLFVLLATACGDDECENDHQCQDGEVCEPAGCRNACEDDEDCRAGYECALRQVEDGRVCVRGPDFR